MKREAYLKYYEARKLGPRGLKIWGYGRKGGFVCRLEINSGGIAIYKRGNRCLANETWEGLVEKLEKLGRNT